MWKSILAQSVEDLWLSYLCECFVWPSLPCNSFGFTQCLFFYFFYFLKQKRKI